MLKPALKPGARFLLICLVLVYGIYAIRSLEPGYTFAKYDPGWMVSTVMSIVEDGDIDLRNQLKNDPNQAADQTSQGVRGEWYPLHEFLMPLVTVPLYLLMGILGCLLFNVVVAIALIMTVYGLCCRHLDEQTAFIAAALTAFTTLISDYVYSYSLDVFGAFVLAFSCWVTVTGNRFGGGVIWGLALLARSSNAVTIPAFLAYVYLADTTVGLARLRQGARALGLFLLGVLPSVLALGASNWVMFGSPLATSYSRWQHFESAGAVVRSQGNAFAASLLERLPHILFDQKTGLFMGAPLLLIAVCFGMRPFWRTSRNEALLFSLISIGMIVLFSKYSLSVPGFPGNRYLMPVVALGAVPLGFAVREALGGMHSKAERKD